MTQTKDELEPGTETETETDGSVQGCYDECDGVPSFVIADVSTDDAWLAVPAGAEIAVDSVQ